MRSVLITSDSVLRRLDRTAENCATPHDDALFLVNEVSRTCNFNLFLDKDFI